MPVLAYCIFDPSARIPEIATGVMQSPVHHLTNANLAVLYSIVESIPSDPGELAQAAMSFQSTVQQVFGVTMVIPFRFPTLLASQDELAAHLAAHADRYSAAVKTLAGLAQMEIRLTRLAGPIKDALTGTEYLKVRQAESQSTYAAIAALREAAGDLVREWRDREVSGAMRSYALIGHDAASEFKRRVGLVRLAAGSRAVISGPWPPSEFLPEEK